MPFLPPPAHATNFWRSTYCSIRPDCLLLLSYGVLTVTNPSDVLYKPVTVWPWRSRTDCGLARASFRLVVSERRSADILKLRRGGLRRILRSYPNCCD
jgi:hypothetical protein